MSVGVLRIIRPKHGGYIIEDEESEDSPLLYAFTTIDETLEKVRELFKDKPKTKKEASEEL